LALVNLTGGTFSARSHAPHPGAISRPFIDQIQNIPALGPEQIPLRPTSLGLGLRLGSPRALILWSLADLGLVVHVSLVALAFDSRRA
jgi:hypothetical protein